MSDKAPQAGPAPERIGWYAGERRLNVLPGSTDINDTMITSNGGSRCGRGSVSAPGQFAGLLDALEKIDLSAVAAPVVEQLLRATQIDDAALASFVYFLPGRYTRVCVHRDERFELLVLCWSPGAQSPVHNHGGSRCFVKVQRGSLYVDNYAIGAGGAQPGRARLTRAGGQIMRPGDLDVRSSARDIHRVGAHGGAAISLHLYAKPLDECLVFDLASETSRTARNQYDIPPA